MSKALLRYSLVVALLFAGLTGSGLYFAAQYEQSRIATIISREQSKLKAIEFNASLALRWNVEAVTSIAAEIERINNFGELADTIKSDAINAALTSALATKIGYDDISILSPQGIEVVRFNSGNQEIVSVPNAELQDESSLDYFRTAMEHEGNQVLLARVALNGANGELDPRRNAATRIMRWLNNSDGSRFGLLALSFRSRDLYGSYRQAYHNPPLNELFMVSPAGMIIVGGERYKDLEFAVDRGIEDGGLNDVNPALWSAMQQVPSGTYQDESGLYIFGITADYSEVRPNSRTAETVRAIIYLSNASLNSTSVIRKKELYTSITLLYAALLGMAIFYWRNLQLKNAAAEAKLNLEYATDIGGIGIFQLNARTREYEYVNDAYREIMAFPETDFPAITADLVESRLVANTAEAMEQIVSNVDDFDALPGEAVMPDGSIKYLLSKGTLVNRANGPVYMGAVIDYTEQVEREQALRQTSETLTHQTAQQRKIFSIISHELRTPAAAIQMLTDELEVGETERGELQSVTTHLLNVIDDLRTAVNPYAEVELRIAPFELATLLAEVERQTSSLATNGGFKLNVSGTDAATQVFLSDAYRLRAVLTNLIRNSVLHSNGSHIWLSAEVVQEGPEWQLTFRVEDDGKGIPVEQVDRLFQPFERGDTNAGGTGVGMYLIQTWTERLGGHVEYSPSVHGGAGFTVTVKVPEAQPLEKDVSTATLLLEAKAVLKGKRVMLAEDDALLRRATSRSLQRNFGIDVVMAEDGQRALELLKSDSFDLLIADYFMPNLDGRQLILDLRRQGRALPIIAITAAIIGEEPEELKEAGADAVLAKPLNVDHFAAEILALVANKRL